MIDYKYTYLLMGIIFFVIWISLYLWRKDTRKPMIIMSIIFAFIGPLTDIVYTKDWWSPQNILGLKVGIIEAAIVGFMIGGIATVIYEDVFKKRIKPRKKRKKKNKEIRIIFITLLGLLIFFTLFFIINLNSFVTTVITLIILIVIIWIKRKDLIIDSIVTGFLFLIIAIITYSILEFLTPGWVNEFWHFKNIPNIIIFNVPIDDWIWYFLAGACIGPLYEYWQEKKLVSK